MNREPVASGLKPHDIAISDSATAFLSPLYSSIEALMGLLAGTIFDREPHCERCDRPESECGCPPIEAKPNGVSPQEQTARLSIEKRKKGKTVTVVRGLAASDNDFPTLLTILKNHCGAGGTSDADTLEIQGDQLERVKAKLRELGYKIR